jgi:hypothetical protein
MHSLHGETKMAKIFDIRFLCDISLLSSARFLFVMFSSKSFRNGCQIFIGTTYQNGKNAPNKAVNSITGLVRKQYTR